MAISRKPEILIQLGIILGYLPNNGLDCIQDDKGVGMSYNYYLLYSTTQLTMIADDLQMG